MGADSSQKRKMTCGRALTSPPAGKWELNTQAAARPWLLCLCSRRSPQTCTEMLTASLGLQNSAATAGGRVGQWWFRWCNFTWKLKWTSAFRSTWLILKKYWGRKSKGRRCINRNATVLISETLRTVWMHVDVFRRGCARVQVRGFFQERGRETQGVLLLFWTVSSVWIFKKHLEQMWLNTEIC